MSCKIAIIGAGSANFSLNLVKDICVNKNFNGCTVALMDVDAARLDAIYGLCTRYTEEMNGDVNVLKTMDRREAMQGADFVINVALDYGHERFKQGIKVAYDHGYRFGGSLHVLHDEAFFINFHQLKLMEEILVDMLDICPKAYYIMVANPVQAGVTYLQRKYKDAKIIGMCHGYTGLYRLADIMGMDRKDISFEVAGVNHFIWLTSFKYKGEDGYKYIDEWIEKHNGKIVEDMETAKAKYGLAVDEASPKTVALYKKFGLFPIGDAASAGGGAWGWEYHTDDETEELYGNTPYQWYQDYFVYCDKSVADIKEVVENKDIKVSEAFSDVQSDEPMIPLIEGLAFDTHNKVIVNILNDGGYMKGLPTDYEVEIAAIISKDKITPICNDGLPKEIMAHLYRDRIAPVEVELAAFEKHSKELLLDLIMMDPWTKSRKQAEELLDAIFALPCNADMKEYYK